MVSPTAFSIRSRIERSGDVSRLSGPVAGAAGHRSTDADTVRSSAPGVRQGKAQRKGVGGINADQYRAIRKKLEATVEPPDADEADEVLSKETTDGCQEDCQEGQQEGRSRSCRSQGLIAAQSGPCGPAEPEMPAVRAFRVLSATIRP